MDFRGRTNAEAILRQYQPTGCVPVTKTPCMSRRAVLRVECRSDSDSQRMTGQDDLNVGGTTGTVYRYSSRTDNVSVRAFLFFRSLYRGKEDTVYSAMAVRRRTL